MYYKTQPGTATHEKLVDVFNLMNEIRNENLEWVVAQGAERRYPYYTGSLVNRPAGLYFRGEVPAGWRYSKKLEAYTPDRKTATGKKIAKEFDALRRLSHSVLQEALGYQWFMYPDGRGGLRVSNIPGISLREDVFYLDYPDEYPGPIPEDLIEIFGSEYRAATEKKEEAHAH